MIKDNKKLRKRLFSLGLLSSPLFGVFTVFPIFLIVNYSSQIGLNGVNVTAGKIILAISTITSFILIQWIINIFIFTSKKQIHQKYKWLKYVVSYVIIFVIITSVGFVFEPTVPVQKIPFSRFYPYIGAASNNTFIILVISLIINQFKTGQLKQEKSRLEAKSIEAQHEVLKQQIHPHFLFNCLSNLKVLQRKDSNKASEYLETLSSFLRLSLSKSNQDLSYCIDEINFLRLYLDLQKVRFGDSLIYDLNIGDETLRQRKLPVFTLQILVENAIKHNKFSKQQPLHIKIQELNDIILVENNKIDGQKNNLSLGIGLNNLSNRYNLLQLPPPIIENTELKFLVKLTVI